MPTDKMMPAFILLGIVLGMLLLLGYQKSDTIYLRKDPCRQPGTYCHVYIVNGGTINISFPDSNGTLTYGVEG